MKEAWQAIKFTLLALSPILIIFVILAIIGFIGAFGLYYNSIRPADLSISG